MTKRKLASVRVVSGIRPIPKADRLEVAMIGGWRCVVPKGVFKEGDSGVYFEIDAVIPLGHPRYAVLDRQAMDSPDGGRVARIRTLELRGELSQGLLLPTSDFPDVGSLSEGDDLTGLLGVLKWEDVIPDELVGLARGYLPGRIPRTSQERLQNCPEILLSEDEWEGTQKIDGFSMTVYSLDGYVGVCSHDVDLLERSDCPYWTAAIRQGLVGALGGLAGEWALQGELAGPGIRGNKDGLAEKEFFLFNVENLSSCQSLPPTARHEFAAKLLECGASMSEVPVICRIVPASKFATMEEALEFSDGDSAIGGGKREGLVYARISDGKSVKAISNAYLLGELPIKNKGQRKGGPGSGM